MRLDISVGPVQGFVAQSRRTRDLWGSSYLLSFLAAHAMHGAERTGGRIIQPVVENDPLYRWVSGRREGESPRIGSVPNHFVVEVDGDAPDAARAGIRGLEAAWKQVCDAVWDRFVEHACPAGNETAHIWGRQVRAFWEVTWTTGPSGERSGLLARRKHWRSHRPPDEPGDKCTVMHDLQELSGYVRGESCASRAMQDRFWNGVHERLGPLDLRDNERLCAIALVKRLFPKVAPKALGWEVDTSHWPSTVYVGAIPWVREVTCVAPQQAREYAEAIRQSATGVLAERQPPFTGLDQAAAGDFPKLDANYFHRDFVKNGRLCPLSGDTAGGARDELARQLATIYAVKDETGRQLGPPSSFYALLLADGDHLGRLVGGLGGIRVGQALSTFTGQVRQIVENRGGVTLYAGGDDVLAMLPVPDALACADKLSDTYRAAFGDTQATAQATLSAAVVFAQIRLPLTHVLGEAHRLLDAVAKDGNGRDSLAAAVLKPGGLNCQWTTAWVRRNPDGQVRAVASLGNLVEQINASTAEPGLSSSLIYRIRDTLTRLCGWEQWRPGDWGNLPQRLDTRALLRAEIHHSLDVRMDDGAETRAGELTASVWNLLGPARNRQVDDPGIVPKGNGNAPIAEAGVDALLLARFLADPAQQESDR